MSERLLGAVVGVHGDDKGLVLPPAIAPFQVVIVPILAKGKVEEVDRSRPGRCAMNSRPPGYGSTWTRANERPGSKFYNWEIKGVPLRLELGMRDIEKEEVAYAHRDDGKKGTLRPRQRDRRASAPPWTRSPRTCARRRRSSWTQSIITIDNLEFKEVPEKWLRFGWCGEQECGQKVEETHRAEDPRHAVHQGGVPRQVHRLRQGHGHCGLRRPGDVKPLITPSDLTDLASPGASWGDSSPRPGIARQPAPRGSPQGCCYAPAHDAPRRS